MGRSVAESAAIKIGLPETIMSLPRVRVVREVVLPKRFLVNIHFRAASGVDAHPP